MIKLNELKKLLNKNGIPAYRANQVFDAVYKKGIKSYEEMHVLPQNVKDFLKDNVNIFSFEIKTEKQSKDKSAIKTLLKLKSGGFVETVLLRFKDGRNTVCVSSQIGCTLNCAFCSTGKMGYKRDLNFEEITDQALYFQGKLRKSDQKINHIVFMGMGEPFLNYKNVSDAIKIFNDPLTFNIGKRNITVSTAGIIPGIEKFSEDHDGINLAVSLHASNQKLREKLMPIAKKYEINDLIKACQKYINKTHRRITYEYIMLRDINDDKTHAYELANLIRGQLCHVNIINYNKTPGSKFKPSTNKRIEDFVNILETNQIPVTLRVSLGDDINGACGQLAGKKNRYKKSLDI
jgi:23S rRNA (adenine2503-C2)-methyltransferase